MVGKEAQRLAKATAVIIRQYVKEQLEPLQSRIAELEQREREFKYCGTRQAAAAYREGNFVTHDGSIFHANRHTRAKPGTSDDWTLACKRGKDAGR